MEEAKGVVKHVLLAKFKDSTTPDQIEELIKGYANLVNLVPPMKAFHWGKDVSAENMHQGFTHVFESTFESAEAIAEYVAHGVCKSVPAPFGENRCSRLQAYCSSSLNQKASHSYRLSGRMNLMNNRFCCTLKTPFC